MKLRQPYNLITPVGCKSPMNFKIQTFNPDYICFEFNLKYGWDALLDHFSERLLKGQRGAYNTQKVFGVSDIFGNNSVRLGVRLGGNKVQGFYWYPILYAHIGGSIYQSNFDVDPQLITDSEEPYRVSISKITDSPYPDQVGCYQAALGIGEGRPFSYAITPSPVTIKNMMLLPSRTSGPYVECFNAKNKKVGTIVELETEIALIK